jgi:hypothetical protein
MGVSRAHIDGAAGKSALILADDRGVPDLELIPRPASRSPSGLRVVGPGRRERTYRERIDRLEDRTRDLSIELDVSRRLERGCQRLIDRMEVHQERDRERLAGAEQREKRLAVALGAMQRENELLRERLRLAGPGPKRLAARERPTSAARRSWLDRLLGRRPRS